MVVVVVVVVVRRPRLAFRGPPRPWSPNDISFPPYWESLLSPFPSPPAPKLHLHFPDNSPMVTFHLPRVEKRRLFFQSIFSSLSKTDFWWFQTPDLPSKVVQNQEKMLPKPKKPIFQNLVFYLHGSTILKDSGLPKSSKITKNQVSRTRFKKHGFSDLIFTDCGAFWVSHLGSGNADFGSRGG